MQQTSPPEQPSLPSMPPSPNESFDSENSDVVIQKPLINNSVQQDQNRQVVSAAGSQNPNEFVNGIGSDFDRSIAQNVEDIQIEISKQENGLDDEQKRIIQAFFDEDKISVDDFSNLRHESYHMNPFVPIQTEMSKVIFDAIDQEEAQNWSLFNYAVYFNQTAIVRHFLESIEYRKLFNPMIIFQPPQSSDEFHVMVDEEEQTTAGGPRKHLILRLITNNENDEMLDMILTKFQQFFLFEDLIEIANLQLTQFKATKWLQGIRCFLRSQTTQLLYLHLQPEEKYELISNQLIEPIQLLKQKDLLDCVITELYQGVYSSFTALNYPLLFLDDGKLASMIMQVTESDIDQFILAKEDKSNVRNLFNNRQKIENELQKVLQGQTYQQKFRFLLLQTKDKSKNEQHVLPIDPTQMIQFIQNNDTKGFISHFEQLKKNHKLNQQSVSSSKKTKEFYDDSANENLQLFRYNGYQIQSIEEQQVEVEFLPTDEALQHILFDFERPSNNSSRQSMDTDDLHLHLLKKLKTKVMHTEQWNPLIFAIFYQRIDIVKYIFKMACNQDEPQFQQHLFHIISEPFRITRPPNPDQSPSDRKNENQSQERSDTQMKEEEYYKFIRERSALIPLVLTLITNNHEMFSFIWNHEMLWNKHKYLILLSSIIYDTQNPFMIKTFITATKTINLFSSMSQSEKEKFTEFTMTSLEKYFVENQDYLSSMSFNPKGLNESQIETLKIDMETVLNKHMLVQIPYSFVNLTRNLVPLYSDSTLEDLMAIFREYQENQDALEILLLTLQNLSTRDISTQKYHDKWRLVNEYPSWSKNAWRLIEELRIKRPQAYQRCQLARVIRYEILEPFFSSNPQ